MHLGQCGQVKHAWKLKIHAGSDRSARGSIRDERLARPRLSTGRIGCLPLERAAIWYPNHNSYKMWERVYAHANCLKIYHQPRKACVSVCTVCTCGVLISTNCWVWPHPPPPASTDKWSLLAHPRLKWIESPLCDVLIGLMCLNMLDMLFIAWCESCFPNLFSEIIRLYRKFQITFLCLKTSSNALILQNTFCN